MYNELLGASALAGLAMAAGAASAGPCDTEKQLSSADARMASGGKVEETGNLHPNQGGSTTNSGALADKPDSVFDPLAAEKSLKRARQFDQAGDGEACVNEVRTARMRLGIQ